MAAQSHPPQVQDSSPETIVLPNAKNPPAFQLDYDEVDYFNLIDRETHTYCAVTDLKGKADLVNAINSYLAKVTTTDQPDPQNLRLLQLRFQDGTKREYWLHNNVIMVDDTAYKMNDELRLLYNLVVGRVDASGSRMGAEWLGFMNPYRITELIFDAPAGKTYTATATDQQRDIILKVAETLKALIVHPTSTRSLPRADCPNDLLPDASPLYALTLNFEGGQSVYTVGVYEDGTVSIAVNNIDYLLAYDAEQNATFVALTKALQKYATD